MSRLRIGWATPWNAGSAIAASAAAVAQVLAERGHEITVLRTEVGEAAASPPRPAPGPVRHLDEYDDDALRRDFDVVAVHIGDHHGHHGAAIPRMGPVDVVGIFHDASIADLARAYFQPVNGAAVVRDLAHRLYGPDDLGRDEPFPASPERMKRRRPMLEWLARYCVGAVAHAECYAERLRTACPGPVAVIPLAIAVAGLPRPPPAWNQLTVATIGPADPDQRIDRLILAIGASGTLRARCRLRVIGSTPDEARGRLSDLAGLVGAAPPEFTGRVSDDELHRRLRDVDVIACLRDPVPEGVPASVILALASGRPTLVSDHGRYAEILRDAALPCRPEAEAVDAMRHLEWVLAHPAEASALGARGRRLTLARHGPEAYADALIPLLEAVSADRPRREARRHLLSTLGSLGLDEGDPAAGRVGAVLEGMGLVRVEPAPP